MTSESPDWLEFIGTATVLMRIAGFTILTDPNFLHRGDRVHLGYGLQAKRLTDPSRELADIPGLNFVLLSHFHEDHFDRYVQRTLNRRMPIVTTPQAARALAALGFTAARGLATWETLRFESDGNAVEVSALPGKHGPGPLSYALPEVMGTLLDARDAAGRRLRIYITGDTLLHDRIAEIPARFPDIDLVLLHLGGTRVLGVLVTMDAAQGVRMLEIVAPKMAVPIHYDDYDRFTSPLEDFERAVDAAGLQALVRYVRRGERLPLRAVSD